jgi:parallel beta-helix repeat protein
MKQSIVKSPISSPVSGTIVSPVNSFPSGNAIRLTEAEWEALTEYDWEQAYIVEGVGEYLGPTLVEAADWAPAAGDYYVAKTGHDTNNNGLSVGAPKLTILGAINAVSTSNPAPVTIWVDAGTYAENSGGYMLINGKSFANMVTIRGIPGTRPIITNVSGSFVVRPNGTCGNIRFRNVEVQGTASATTLAYYNGSSLSNFEFVECHFNDTQSRLTGISFAGTGQSNLAVKRCTFESASRCDTSTTVVTGFKFIGNDYQETVFGGVTAGGGTHTINSNKLTGSITLAGHASTATSFQVYANQMRNMVHTGGATGNRSTINFNRNTVNAGTGVRGVSVIGYWSSDSTFDDNDVTSLGLVGIAVPDDGATSAGTGYKIRNNRVTNYGTNGHAILLSTGSFNAEVTGNETDASGGGNYGVVLKGTGHAIGNNVFRGGALNGILMKDASGCDIIGNTIYSSGASAVALRFDNASGMEVSGNTFHVTGGVLYSLLLADGANNIVDENIYNIDSPGAWGTMFGTTVSSLANVQAQWAANYPNSPTNDNASTSV